MKVIFQKPDQKTFYSKGENVGRSLAWQAMSMDPPWFTVQGLGSRALARHE